jgi:signal transduction histidine kinase/ActR/RegA family two-component response regulator
MAEQCGNDLLINDHTTLNSIPSGVGIYDVTGDHIEMKYLNDGYYQMIDAGRDSRSRFFGSNVSAAIHPDDLKKILDEAHASVRENRMFGMRFRVLDGNDSYIWIGIRANHISLGPDTERFFAAYYNVDAYISRQLMLETRGEELSSLLEELKAAEQSRDEIRKMYEAAVEDANLVVWEYDIIDHRIIMAENESTEYDYRKFGLPKITDNAPQSLVPYIDDKYVDVFLDMYRRIDNGEPSASCEVWYKLVHNMEPRCERIFYSTVYDADGKPFKAYGIGQNITRRKLAEAEYDRLRAQLTVNLKDVVSSTQLNISRNLYISGYSPYPGVEESLRRDTADGHFAAAASAIDNEGVKQSIQKEFVCTNLANLFQSGRQQLERVYPVRTSDGGIMWVRTTLQMMQNPSTGDIEGITYSKDITEEKRAQEIISRISSTGCDFIGVIDVTENSFKMHTSNWNCDEVAAGQKYDYDLVRRKLSDGYIASDRRAGFIEASSVGAMSRILDGREQYLVVYDYIDTSVSDAPLKKQIIFSWLNDEKREILCIQQDVTVAYQKEQEYIAALEKAKLDAENANEAKSAFLSGMSHDLRTPLNGVLGFTAFALKENDPGKKQGYLEKIDTSGKLLRDLINDTLELSRIESGKAGLEIEAVMPEDLIPAVTTALKPSADLKDIRFETDFETDMSAPVWCDRLKVQKIALNLISNAIKYTLDGGTVCVSLKMDGQGTPDSRYVLTVKDTGIGMSEEFIKRMYEPFSQEKRSESVKEPGTGLGLSIVKRYVDLMGGTISVTSRLHEGTCIQVSIPVSTGDIGPEDEKEDDSSVQELAGKNVLLCEDNYMNTEIAVMLLKDRGINVLTAENGKDGLEKFMASAIGGFDAILMDIRMPVMDGYEATRRIRELGRADASTVKIIAMTADAFEESVRDAMKAGMDAYVTKPIEPATLYQQLAKCIGHNRKSNKTNLW